MTVNYIYIFAVNKLLIFRVKKNKHSKGSLPCFHLCDHPIALTIENL